MKFNFIVRATAWDTPDKDTWEADFIPMWFDDETKKKINEVIIQGYNRYKHKFPSLKKGQGKICLKFNRDKMPCDKMSQAPAAQSFTVRVSREIKLDK